MQIISRFKKNPIDPETLAKTRILRLKMLLWLLPGTLGYFVLEYLVQLFLGVLFFVIIAALIPGIIVAAWAKFIMLRANWRTGLLAVCILLFAVSLRVFYRQWHHFTSWERMQMIRTIVVSPDKADQYPEEPVREDIRRAALELAERNVSNPQLFREQSNLIAKLDNQYGKTPFQTGYQLRRIWQKVAEYPQDILFKIFGFSIFNLMLAYAFAATPHAFCGIPHLNIAWH